MFSKETKKKIRNILQWTKFVAKMAALGTAVAGAITALTSSSASAGLAMGAAGTSGYAAATCIPTKGYQTTKHVPPVPAAKPTNMRDMGQYLNGPSKAVAPMRISTPTRMAAISRKRS